MAIACLFLTGCSNQQKTKGIYPMVVSLSSDGQYAISTNANRHAYLWNIKQRTYKKISDYPINIYSAYFIKNTDKYMYQHDKTNEVIIRNTKGKTIKTLNPGFPTYGEVINSNLTTYFAADNEFNVYKIARNEKTQINVSSCINGLTGAVYRGPLTSTCTGFLASGKLMNLTFSPNEKHLIGADGLGYVYSWKVDSGKGKVFEKNNNKTFATISPDSRHIISGDIAGGGLIINTIKNYKAHNFFFRTPKKSEILNFITTTKQNNTNIVSVKFIDKNHIIVIYNSAPYPFNYATLYSINDIKNIRKQHPDWSYGYILNPIKYLNLLTTNKPNQPLPITQSNVRDQAIDTSPTAHILVMAQARNNGILVYKYNPKTQILKQIWAPVIKTPWWHIW